MINQAMRTARLVAPIQQDQIQLRGGEVGAYGYTPLQVKANRQGLSQMTRTLSERGAAPDHTVVGLEASGHLWENLEASLSEQGYRVLVLNPLQLRRFREVLRAKAKTDDLDAYLIAGLLRSGQAQVGAYGYTPLQPA